MLCMYVYGHVTCILLYNCNTDHSYVYSVVIEVQFDRCFRVSAYNVTNYGRLKEGL